MSRSLPAVGGRRPVAVGRHDSAVIVHRVLQGSTRVRVGVTGSGGSGKSTVLDDIADGLRSGGIEVVRHLGAETPSPADPRRLAMLIDDVEQFGDRELAVLAELSRSDGAHLVIAFRPWPRPPALGEIIDGFDDPRDVIVLRELTPSEVQDRAGAQLARRLSDDEADRILEMSGGNPRFVDVMLESIRDEQWDVLTLGELPPILLERVRRELDRLSADVADLLLAFAVGFVAGPVLATAPRFAGVDLRSLISAARASGTVRADGLILPLVREAIVQGTPEYELWTMRRDLVEAIDSAGLPLDGAAKDLAEHGYRDPRVANAVRSMADRRLHDEPAEASRLYSAAVLAGAGESTVAARHALAAWAAGDARLAERLVDGVLAGAERVDLPMARDVAAAVWARRGMLRRSVDAYLGPESDSAHEASPLAAVCLAGLGEVSQARELMTKSGTGHYPTSMQVAISLTADGIVDALSGATDHALPLLMQASTVLNESGDEAVALPEAPAVLAAQLALSTGEPGIAAGILQAAVDATQGGPAFCNRLRLTQALIALRGDRPLRARAILQSIEDAHTPLGLRDEFLAHSVRIGLARHTDDIPSLVHAWNTARSVIVRASVDLFALPALGEIIIASARLHEGHLVDAHVADAWELIDRAGHPASWATSLHWACAQAAILRHDGADLARHERALVDAARSDKRVAAPLARAAQIWSAALTGEVDVDAVERAVRGLASAGYPWDARRLAAHAAARAAEHRDTLQLLALARALHPEEERAVAADSADEASRAARDESVLSPREREVARLVLEGKTYAEIGSAIFISPRTAEHHIARIRRRLGATTRSELLARLRLALDDDGAR